MQENNILQNIKNSCCILLLAVLFLYLLLNWKTFPDQIPAHYDAAGSVDRWGSKMELLLFPIVTLILYFFITVLEHKPQIWNTGVTVTAENKNRVYCVLKDLIVTVKLLMIIAFFSLSIFQSTAKALPGWSLPVYLGVLFGTIIYYIVKLNKLK